MFFSFNTIVALLIKYRYLAIAPIAVVEGPIIAILSGFLTSIGAVNGYLVYLLLVLGDFVGDTIFYSIGRFGGYHFLKRWGKYFGASEVRLRKLESVFKNHSGKLLLFGKTQAIGGVILTAAGVIKMPYWRFIGISMAGTVIKSFILFEIGYYFGKAISNIQNIFNKSILISILILITIVIVYIIHKRKNI